MEIRTLELLHAEALLAGKVKAQAVVVDQRSLLVGGANDLRE